MLSGLGVTVLPEAEVKIFSEVAPALDKIAATAPLYVLAFCKAAKRTQTVVPLATDTDVP